jgi:hypothetical protein
MHKIKIDMRKFDNEDDQEGTRWINKFKQYFEICQIHDEEEKINLVLMHLERSDCDRSYGGTQNPKH